MNLDLYMFQKLWNNICLKKLKIYFSEKLSFPNNTDGMKYIPEE